MRRWEPLRLARGEAAAKALDALAQGRFGAFGLWAARWTHLNRACPDRLPSPFASLVLEARNLRARRGEGVAAWYGTWPGKESEAEFYRQVHGEE